MFTAQVSDPSEKHRDSLRGPGNFAFGDGKRRLVAGIDIGAPELREASPLEPAGSGPDRLEALAPAFGEDAQLIEVVRAPPMKGQRPRDTLIEMFAGLMEQQCGHPHVTLFVVEGRARQEVFRAGIPSLELRLAAPMTLACW